MSAAAIPEWNISDRIYSEKELEDMLHRAADEYALTSTPRAMDYAGHAHRGQLRKRSLFSTERVPYINHPLTIACQAYALGFHDDALLSVCLLHDVCEDCGVEPDDLPFSSDIRHSVMLLTRHPGMYPTAEEDQEHYYEGIRTDINACLVKVMDRCNNISTMAVSFTRERMVDYIEETRKYIVPLLPLIRQMAPAYENQVFLLRYHLESVLISMQAMLMR